LLSADRKKRGYFMFKSFSFLLVLGLSAEMMTTCLFPQPAYSDCKTNAATLFQYLPTVSNALPNQGDSAKATVLAAEAKLCQSPDPTNTAMLCAQQMLPQIENAFAYYQKSDKPAQIANLTVNLCAGATSSDPQTCYSTVVPLMKNALNADSTPDNDQTSATNAIQLCAGANPDNQPQKCFAKEFADSMQRDASSSSNSPPHGAALTAIYVATNGCQPVKSDQQTSKDLQANLPQNGVFSAQPTTGNKQDTSPTAVGGSAVRTGP
jgi:hypothetical protein